MGRENQLIGAFGERAVEAELLRRGWLTSNVNASIKNAADYDIIALKSNRTIHLRVKTCGPGWNKFQFGGFRPGKEIEFKQLPTSDYTVLVRMGGVRGEDTFYVIPSRVLREQLNTYRRFYLAQSKRNGQRRKDIGHWSLHLADIRGDDERPNYGCGRKWETQGFLNNWDSLER